MVHSTVADDGSPGQGHSALVLAGREAYAERRALSEHAGVSPVHANVLAVTYDLDAADWLSDWRDRVGGRAASMAVLSPDEFARSAAAAPSSTHELPGRTTVEAIEDPTDLDTLGGHVRTYLSRWEREDRQCVLLFESVTRLLSHVPARTAFGFLHLLVHESRRTGALGWFYADPDAHPPAVVGAVADLFDSVVRPHDDGWRSAREYLPADGDRRPGTGRTTGSGTLPEDRRPFDDER